MKAMIDEIQMAYGGRLFLVLYVAFVGIGLIVAKNGKKLFLIPSIIITAVILTPLFYKAWNKVNGYAYWRTLWMIPFVQVYAAVSAALIQRVKRISARAAVFCVAVGAVILVGSYVYSYQNTTFKRVHNADKLPEDVVDVAQALLEIDDQPMVVSDTELSVYLRQYSGKIKAAYSRDIVYGLPTATGKAMYEHLSAGEMSELAQLMINQDYEYLATRNAEGNAMYDDAGFELVRQVGAFGIYRVHGRKTEQREYNEHHQVISITTVDESGNPHNGSKGYATVRYEYDQYGRVSKEFYTDVDGRGVANDKGVAGYSRIFDRFGKILRETKLGANGQPVVDGCATTVCQYDKKHRLIKELYYGVDNEPMLRTDTLIAGRTILYNGDNDVVKEQYFGIDGEPKISSAGYAAYVREYEDNAVTERYLDEDGKPIRSSEGYACIRREYNVNNQLILEAYYDEQRQPLKLQLGYAGFIREYDAQGNAIRELFFDSDNEPVIQGRGYAEKRYVFNAANQLVEETYYGLDGQLVDIDSGYARIQNTYTEDGELSLSYFSDSSGNALECGSAFFHNYLLSLRDRRATVMISAKDDASNSFTATLYEDMKALGLETDLRGKNRQSYIAVISANGILEEIDTEPLEYSGYVDGLKYVISSAGYWSGNYSSIVINGTEYSKNCRGLNIVVVENGVVSEAIAFDTWAQEMTVTR